MRMKLRQKSKSGLSTKDRQFIKKKIEEDDPDLLALEALDNPSKKAAASHQSVKNLRGQKKTARRKSKAYAKLRGKKRR